MKTLGWIALAATLATVPALAQTGKINPVIKEFGGYIPVPGVSERPDPSLRYRVLFSVSKGPASADKPNPSLERVAKFINLLGEDKVRPAPGDVAAIIHGAAIPLILKNEHYAARTKTAVNPNIALIDALRQAGVSIRVCGQAMQASGIKADQVLPGVEIDDSALVTIPTLQLRGYAFFPD